jgi:hypothetical protein
MSASRLILAFVIGLACASAAQAGLAVDATRPSDSAGASTFSKRMSFAILEDYDKGEDLREVERDFALMQELGITTWRGSFGWDDYEPTPGHYDFAWLHRFVKLAARHGIQLRPYIGYTPAWAGVERLDDSEVWNDPPARLEQFNRFVEKLARALQQYPNLRSYEIYNEENVEQWWDGTVGEYNAVLAAGANAIRAQDPDAQVLLGGMVWPDVEWLEATCAEHANADRIDVVPFHAYPETWTPASVTVENYLDASYRRYFIPVVEGACGGKPIWINETGFATTPGKTERQQANWWARAIATFVADRRVEHIGVYEIKDAARDQPVIGDAPNYYLGLTQHDRTKKLAFDIVRLLAGLLNGRIHVADAALTVSVEAGTKGRLFHHLFRRADGRQILVIWDKRGAPRLSIRLFDGGHTAVEHALNGASSRYDAFDGQTLRDVQLRPGEVRIFEIRPAS